ncbi:HD-GYP domain-containing protein [Virgibacillus sp. AGTR]|uniref:HD-GYP domain-containing protein n=1 Tax=Virgibacillus sp. AGTR TaxID=2812055 RepID=UPI001966BE54|nr:HD-GYP domain-containing protein [Virgibacillus sp. AGTR]MCC2249494.1 HD-GYP domain-containing protein [Virgibacillus sp. AGTR]QRZ17859.1 HD-GYP domain-containing protein [Virgibacillus sp. AGTR]
MRLANTRSIEPGAILAKTIYNESGVILVNKGVALTKQFLDRLVKHGITYIYIEDEEMKDIAAMPTISKSLRREASETIKEVFLSLQHNGLTNRSYILDQKGSELSVIVQQITNELQQNEQSLSLLTDMIVSDNYIFQHSLNVAIYALAIGVKLKLSNKQLEEIGMAAMLHDVGKLFINPDILQKPGKLTEEEFKIIQNHTRTGYRFLVGQDSVPFVVSLCALQHHERLDGSGYPLGITSESIHKYAKLIGIADVFDAVTSNRVYRDPMLPHEGLEILYAGSGQLYDREMIEALKSSIVVYPNGIMVDLNDGRQGIVVKQNPHVCDRPIIRINKEQGRKLAKPYDVNLANVLNVVVFSCKID